MIARTIVRAGLVAALAMAALSAAHAGEQRPAPDEQLWREECGGCHVAYPARFLSQASWEAVMRQLDDHFGTDASVDEAVATSIRRYLVSAARASSRVKDAPPVLRISEARWFTREHDEVPARIWRSPTVGGAANCAACHRDADAGRFDEDAVNVPK